MPQPSARPEFEAGELTAARVGGWVAGAGVRSASVVVAGEAVCARLAAGLAGHNRQLIDTVCQPADEPGELLGLWTSGYGRSPPQPVRPLSCWSARSSRLALTCADAALIRSCPRVGRGQPTPRKAHTQLREAFPRKRRVSSLVLARSSHAAGQALNVNTDPAEREDLSAEGQGFEPWRTIARPSGFQDRRHRPLGEPSCRGTPAGGPV
jgi:hypothetical protein